MKATFYYLHALSPLHVGTHEGVGVIDMPIAREKATNLPFVPGSAIKGVLRYELKDRLGKDHDALFGPEKQGIDDNTSFAGALTLGDAHLLCFPVRSLVGTFAWATCPFILARYVRDANALNIPAPKTPPLAGQQALITKETKLVHENRVILEDLDLIAQEVADSWATHIAAAVLSSDTEWQKLFKERFVILPDDILDFLAETATEVQARIKIKEDTRVVEKGALWYEENLPIETLLYGMVAATADRSNKNDRQKLEDNEVLGKLPSSIRLQLGGNATTGRGLINWIKRGN